MAEQKEEDGWMLSSQLKGHERDVRAVISLQDGRLATSSRDKTVKVWRPEGALDTTLIGHTKFVGPLLELRDGRVVSGGYDSQILVWDLQKAEPELTLLGHEEAVVCLSMTREGDIVSGSWDKEIRVWRDGEVAQILRGHTGAVWGVLGTANGDIWSSGADKSVRVWRNGNTIKTITCFEDVPRGLVEVPGVGVLVACNDAIVRLFDFEGQLLQQLHGHIAYVYTVAVLAGGERFVSGGEDCSIKVWLGGECEQTIQFPGSVWDVAALPNGDIAVACADWVTRIFTREPSRKASEEDILEFQQKVQASLVQESKVGDLELDKLPGPEALNTPGRQNGQQLIVRKPDGSGAEVHLWNGDAWQLMGDVVGARDKPAAGGAGGNASGKDFSFPVDVNGTKFTISMNKGENLYEVAGNFIQDNGLSNEFLEEIVQFLIQGTGQSVDDVTSIRNSDPFTGTGDPYSRAHVYTSFPVSQALLHSSPVNSAGLLKKVNEFNASEAHKVDVPALEALLASLANASNVRLAEKAFPHVLTMLQWQEAHRFPAIDLCRVICAHQGGARFGAPVAQLATSCLGTTDINSMLALKVFANLGRHIVGRELLFQNVSVILDRAAPLASSTNNKVVGALLAFLQNLFLELRAAKGDHSDTVTQCVAILGELLERAATLSPGAQFGVVAILGSFAWKNEAVQGLIEDLDLLPKIQALAANAPAANVKTAANELIRYLSTMDTSS